MPYNGSGTYSPPAASFPAVTTTVISSTKYNAVVTDQASALSNCMTRDGQSPPTGNIPMGNKKLTGLAAPTLAGDAVSLDATLGITLTGGATSKWTASGAGPYTSQLTIGADASGSTFTQTATGTANAGMNFSLANLFGVSAGDIALDATTGSASINADAGISLFSSAGVTIGASNASVVFLHGASSTGGGLGVVAIANANTVPTTNPTGGGVLYVQSGALKYRGSSGTITTIAPA